jgi:hypothetical protein
MKKLIILMLLVPTLILAYESRDAARLMENLSSYTVASQKKIEKEEKMYTEAIFWTEVYWVHEKKRLGWSFEYDKDKTYIFYATTKTPGTKIKACFEDQCSKEGRYITFRYKPSRSGRHDIYVYYLTEKESLVVGYNTYIQKEYIYAPWHGRRKFPYGK